jgi:hypothetical protein
LVLETEEIHQVVTQPLLVGHITCRQQGVVQVGQTMVQVLGPVVVEVVALGDKPQWLVPQVKAIAVEILDLKIQAIMKGD